jgi:hypothetical protein
MDEGIFTHTHVSDQLSTYGTKVMVATQPEATFVLDEILGNQADLPLGAIGSDEQVAPVVWVGDMATTGEPICLPPSEPWKRASP